MNLIRKLKLKAMLRNCDYVLAGTVIRQQYYDESKNTEINRLIDRFMTNPGFEEALKLIEYNEMMVFYFTESCEDGLYVRKGVQEPRKPAAKEAAAIRPKTDADLTAAGKTAPFFESAAGGATALSRTAETETTDTKSAAAAGAESEGEAGSGEGPSANEPLTEYQRKIKESEEWMEEMIRRLSRKENPARGATRDTGKERTPAEPAASGETAPEPDAGRSDAQTADNHAPLPGSPHAGLSRDRAMDEPPVPASGLQPPAPQSDADGKTAAAADVDMDDVFKHAGADKAMQSLADRSAAARADDFPAGTDQTGDARNWHEEAVTETFEEPFVSSSSHRYDDKLEDTLVYESPPKSEKRAAAGRPDFSNVIATLKIDIHTMTRQIEEYRRQLNYYTPEEKQIRGWIRALEAAVAEFSLAVDLLEGEDDRTPPRRIPLPRLPAG